MGLFAAHIRSLRKNAGLSQLQLAMRVGVGKTTINNVESGYITAPPTDLVEKLAEVFNTDSLSLLNRISLDVGERAKMVHVVSSISSDKPFVEIEKIVETAFLDRAELYGFEYMGLKMPDKAMIEEGILPDASVIIRKDAAAVNGDIVAAIYKNNNAIVRKYYKEDNIVNLKAANSSGLYPDIRINTDKERFVLVGKVIRCTNSYDKK